MSAKETVQEFCDLMAERDAERLRPLLAADIVYQNTGMEAVDGIEAVLESLVGQFAMFPDSYEYRTVNAVAEGDVVMNERIDMIKGPDGNLHGLPVDGHFRRPQRQDRTLDRLLGQRAHHEDDERRGLLEPGAAVFMTGQRARRAQTSQLSSSRSMP